MPEQLLNIAYLVASAMFISGLRGLSHPRTAVRGNLTGALGMFIAIVATLLDHRVMAGGILSYEYILIGIVIGGLAGGIMAQRVPMTGMPQMVALLNGFGGAGSVLVAGAALFEAVYRSESLGLQSNIATAASALVGGVTFWGSLVAFAKLQEVVLPSQPVLFKGQQLLNVLLAASAVVLGVWLVTQPLDPAIPFWALVAVASVLGVLLTIPIGGADMPVVISLLNSYSGIAAAATGFVLNNNMLIIGGSLVGASGIILTQIMCKAMNRSLANVLFGGVGAVIASKSSADAVYAGKVKAASAEEIAMILETARRVVFVPGYGMAVAQAQHAVKQLANLMENRGTVVEYAVHPVAGRMPGHMNVLLAEADVPYDKLKEMDEINPMFAQTDVSIVIGANDVVNPVARTDPNSPIAGMPILDVDKSHTVVVIKRSLSPGFAGIPNPLFAAENTLMFFNDGKQAINELIQAYREVTA